MVSVQRALWILLIIPLFALSAHAASFGTNINTIDNEILHNESASFEVVLSNFEETPAEFQIYTIDPTWNVKVTPLNLVVAPKSQKTVTLYLRPSLSTSLGTQGISLNIKELGSGTIVKKSVVVSLRTVDGYSRDYAPTVTLDISMPYDIDPRNPVPLRLEMRNRNPLNISNLTITVSSEHFATTSSISLAPLSDRTVEITGLTLNPLTPPGEDEIVVQLHYNGQVVGQLVKNYRIKEYTQVKQRIAEDRFFFKTEKMITITNDGNVKNTAVVSVPTSLLKSLFVSSSLPYENEVRDGQRVLVWNVPLDPEETRSFAYVENYRVLVLLVLLAIIGGIAYLLLRSPVVALKEAVAIPHKEGVSDMKVRVFVKNRSSRIIQGIQVTDRVPSLADVLKTEAPGSIAPSKIAVSEKQGTLLRWELDVLEPFEERILTYHVKSKLKIIGHMKLPNAKIRYVVKGKERAVYSNNVEILEKFKDR